MINNSTKGAYTPAKMIAIPETYSAEDKISLPQIAVEANSPSFVWTCFGFVDIFVEKKY